VKLLLFINLFLLLYTTLFSQKKTTSKDFKLRPSKQGGQVGWFDAEGLPTSIKINDEWVLPRNGTMEWLMTKGYVPDSDDKNVMKPNPKDKRYRPPRRILAPSLGLTPVDYIAKPKTLFDPFKGIADPREENFSPRIGDGVKNADNLEGANPGPVLEPELPALKNTPFDEPPQKGQKLPPNDPFAEDNLNQPNQLPEQNKDQLPGKKINLPNSIFNP